MAPLVEGRHGDPFALLGMHGGGDAPLVVRVFRPCARAMRVMMGERLVTELDQTHPAGFFEGQIPRHRDPFPYRLRIGWPHGDECADYGDDFPRNRPEYLANLTQLVGALESASWIGGAE